MRTQRFQIAIVTLLLLLATLPLKGIRNLDMGRMPTKASSEDSFLASRQLERPGQQITLSYPPDPLSDIEWSVGTSGVTDVQAAFNNARTVENGQLGTSLPMLALPDQTQWNGMSDGAKALWLINRERMDRGLAPLDGLESNVNGVAQYYADYLLDHNAWGHNADGDSPWDRINSNPAIGACHDFLSVAENLAVFVTSGSSISLPIERTIYMWMYEDCCGSGWGHRHAILWYPYNDDSGAAGREGFLGIGRANGGPYQGPFSQSWPFAEIIVMNVFDPCARWTYPSVTISGNAGAAGVTLSYTDGTPKTVTANGSGNYSITMPYGWTGTVTPSLGGDAFCPASQAYRNLQANQTAQNYAHAACPNFGSIHKRTSSFDLSHGWTASNYVRTVGDVNGDGRVDVVGFGLDGVYVGISNGNSFAAPSKWTSAFDLSHGWTVSQYVRTVGDVNGDGMDDLVGFGLDGVYVGLSNGSSFAAPSKWTSAFDLSHGWTVSQYVRTVGDVNGDGKDDLVGFGLDGVYVGLSSGSDFGPASKWTSAFDLTHGWTVSQYVRTVGDVNGDGMDDLVGFGLDGVYVALSTGSGFSGAAKWTSAFDLSHGWTVSDYVRTIGDVNADGKDDLVGFGLDGVYIALSTGTSFSLSSRQTTSFDLSHGWTVSQSVRTVGDGDGGGKADLIGFGLDGVYVAP